MKSRRISGKSNRNNELKSEYKRIISCWEAIFEVILYYKKKELANEKGFMNICKIKLEKCLECNLNEKQYIKSFFYI